MIDIFIFSIGIVLGCVISYLFFKTGVNTNIETYKFYNDTDTTKDNKQPETVEYDPETDTTIEDANLDWDSYPYTNEYNDKDSQHQIIGYIDPDTDEPN